MQTRGVKGYRLSTHQERIWQWQSQQGEQYRGQCALLVEGEVQSEVLRAAVEQVVQRHDVLRTVFTQPAGLQQPVQVVRPHGEVEYEEQEVQQGSAAGWEQCVREDVRERGGRGYDLSEGPVLRALLLRMGQEKQVLVLELPALCGDGESLREVSRQVMQGYERLLVTPQEGDEADEEEPLQYVNVSTWQSELLQEEDT